MANMVYANPFGAALAGKQQAINDVESIGKTARGFRDSDLANKFQEWYLPQRQAEIRNQVGSNLLRSAAQRAHMTGDIGPVSHILQEFYGEQPQAGYLESMTPQQRQQAVTLGSNQQFAGYDLPDLYGIGGGAMRALPPPAHPPVDPRMQRLQDLQYRLMEKEMTDRLSGGGQSGAGGRELGLNDIGYMNPSATDSYGGMYNIPSMAHNVSESFATAPTSEQAQAQAASMAGRSAMYSDGSQQQEDSTAGGIPGIFGTPGPHAHESVGSEQTGGEDQQ